MEQIKINKAIAEEAFDQVIYWVNEGLGNPALQIIYDMWDSAKILKMIQDSSVRIDRAQITEILQLLDAQHRIYDLNKRSWCARNQTRYIYFGDQEQESRSGKL